MDSNTKQLMAVFSLMLGLAWGIPYIVSDADERNAGWLMLAVIFLLIALGFYMWLMREQRTAEDAAQDALDAAEENLKKLEAQAKEADEPPVAVEDRDLPPQQAAPDVGLPQTSSAGEIEDVLDDSEDDTEPETIDITGDPEPPAEPAMAVEVEPEPVAVEIEVEEEPETKADDPGSTSEASDEPDDLERIEGIGPKYAEILNDAGITTFEQITAMSEDDIVTLVKANGGRKSASMATWAEQARFAADGDWDGLAQLQDDLNGGRR